MVISFTAASDSVDDDGESVKLTFGVPTGVSTGTTDEAVVSITDDDVPSCGGELWARDSTRWRREAPCRSRSR